MVKTNMVLVLTELQKEENPKNIMIVSCNKYKNVIENLQIKVFCKNAIFQVISKSKEKKTDLLNGEERIQVERRTHAKFHNCWKECNQCTQINLPHNVKSQRSEWLVPSKTSKPRQMKNFFLSLTVENLLFSKFERM